VPRCSSEETKSSSQQDQYGNKTKSSSEETKSSSEEIKSSSEEDQYSIKTKSSSKEIKSNSEEDESSSQEDEYSSKLASSSSSLKEGEAPLPNQALGTTAAALHVLLLLSLACLNYIS